MPFFSHGFNTEDHTCTINTHESLHFLPPSLPNANCCQKFRRCIKKVTLISDRHPLSVDYFRSKAEIFRVRQNQVKSKSFIIHPFSDFRIFYEMWMAVIWFVSLVYFPLDAAFDLLYKDVLDTYKVIDMPLNRFDWFGLMIRLICLTDIFFTFITGFTIKQKRRVVMNGFKIALNYTFSIYFISDLLVSLPLEVFCTDQVSRRVVNSFGFLRIIRLPTVSTYLSRSFDICSCSQMDFFLEILKQIVTNFLLIHWFTCVHYFVPQIRYLFGGDIMSESWLERGDLPQLDMKSKYLLSIYRAIGSLLCINFEELQTEVWEEKLITIITFIFGKVYVFYNTVLILNFLLRLRSLETKYFEVVSQVQAYMSQKQLPMAMQTRLLQFYDYKYNKKFFKERAISGLLSDKLRNEINLNVCSQLVESVSLLANLPPQLLQQVVVYLKPEIYLSSDIIIKAGSVGDCMYFLASGTVGVWTPSGKEVCHLQDGAYFGEISLIFKDKRRTANIVAIEICEVFKLDRKAFRNCFKTNTELYKQIEDVAKERMQITEMFEEYHAKTFLELNLT